MEMREKSLLLNQEFSSTTFLSMIEEYYYELLGIKKIERVEIKWKYQ